MGAIVLNTDLSGLNKIRVTNDHTITIGPGFTLNLRTDTMTGVINT